MRVLSAGCWVLSALVIGASSLHAQVATPADTAAVVPPSTQNPAPGSVGTAPSTPDSVRRPTTPMGAMFRSFALPGWGQAVYGRKVTAGVMMGFEGLTLGMIVKLHSEMEHIEATGSARAEAKKQEQEDWVTLLVFNHLMSGLEAYVSAHLYDFPGDLELSRMPEGGMRLGVTLPLGRR